MSPVMPRPSPCRSCNATVVWCLTASGKRMPVDFGTSAGGTIRISGERAEVLKGDELAREQAALRLHTSHFATCPNAAQHRKPRTT